MGIGDLDPTKISALSLAAMLLLPGCAVSKFVPPEMESEIARDISFESIKAEPEKFTGRIVVLGGQVLKVTTLPGETKIEVLQFPLDRADKPILDLSNSGGRYLAVLSELPDPAGMPAGRNISMVAELIGVRAIPVNGSDYRYPIFRIKLWKIWPKPEEFHRPMPWYPYGDRWAYPFEDPWTHPYWGSY
jgi:outer membrane lipoprotein